jgi:tRNA A-37 threonylcarbamoyl transferase component Bud32
MVIYKFGSRSVVGGYESSDGMPVVLKYYYQRGLHKHLSYGIRGSRARQSWLSGLALNHAGIPTPPALFLAETSLWGGLWLERSLLITGRADGISLQKWVELHEADANRLAAMAARLRDVFSRMARHRIGHGDLKATNVIVAGDDTISLVDLDATTVLNSGARWRRARERDGRIFAANWKARPQARAAFASVFLSSPSP